MIVKTGNIKEGKKREQWKKPEFTKLNIKETLNKPPVGADKHGRS
jgi:hypothetical protein